MSTQGLIAIFWMTTVFATTGHWSFLVLSLYIGWIEAHEQPPRWFVSGGHWLFRQWDIAHGRNV